VLDPASALTALLLFSQVMRRAKQGRRREARGDGSGDGKI